jgi:Ice-binding-like
MMGASNMKTFRGIELSLLLFLLPACGQRLVEIAKPGPADGGAADASTSEAKTSEAGMLDVGNPDAAKPDVTSPDVTRPDAGNPDAGNPDMASPDVGNPDVANPDLASPDVGKIDAGTPDARATDGGTPGNPDVANPDVANPDAPNVANPDVGSPNLGNPDAANPDAPNPGNADVASLDAAEIDAATAANPDAGNIDAEDIDAVDIDTANIDTAEPIIVINLGLATPYAIAATAGVTNTITAPITHINGDVVLDPNKTCNAVTVDNAGGFGLCGGMAPTISGTVITNLYPDTTTSAAIKADLNAAFLSITPPVGGHPAVGTLGGGTAIAAPTSLGDVAGNPLVLGDNWFTPGVYTSGTSILITGDITLDGQGDPNAVFVFQSASSLTTADGAASPGAHVRILLTNGAKASNVWWQVASSATIGSYSEFQGNILAAFDITMKTGATACGRSMAGAWVGGSGAFVFDSNVVSVPGNGCPL